MKSDENNTTVDHLSKTKTSKRDPRSFHLDRLFFFLDGKKDETKTRHHPKKGVKKKEQKQKTV